MFLVYLLLLMSPMLLKPFPLLVFLRLFLIRDDPVVLLAPPPVTVEHNKNRSDVNSLQQGCH
jgi:hypothetical protein